MNITNFQSPYSWLTTTRSAEGPFQYESLPVEIRRQILKETIKVLFKKFPGSEKDFVAMDVSELFHMGDKSDRFDTLEMYRAKSSFETEAQDLMGLYYCMSIGGNGTDEELWDIRRMLTAWYDYTPMKLYQPGPKYEKRKAVNTLKLKLSKPHPQRRIPYNVSCFPLTAGQRFWLQTVATHVLTDIRNLSHVSTGFRKDLAEIIWQRTAIRATNLTALRRFIWQRPQAIQGIKRLHFDIALPLDSKAQYHFQDFNVNHPSFSTLNLEHLSIRIVVKQQSAAASLEDLLHGPELPDWVQFMLNLMVTKGFSLSVVRASADRSVNDFPNFIEGIPMLDFHKDVGGEIPECVEALIAMFMPYSLRPKTVDTPGLSEQEVYCISRAADQGAGKVDGLDEESDGSKESKTADGAKEGGIDLDDYSWESDDEDLNVAGLHLNDSAEVDPMEPGNYSALYL